VQREGEVKEFKVRLMPFQELFRQRLGLDLQELTPDLVAQLGLDRLGGLEAGLLISRVEKESMAETAELREYDVLNAIGGQRVGNYLDAFLAVSQLKPGESTAITVLVPRTRGNVILGYQQGTTELKLR
jgi:S1-C subfamily serine protease